MFLHWLKNYWKKISLRLNLYRHEKVRWQNLTKKMLVIEAYMLLLLAHLAIWLFGFPRTYRWLTKRQCSSACGMKEDKKIQQIIRAVDVAADWQLIQTECLYRSLVQYYMLLVRGIPSNLILGVQKFPFTAHVWVEYKGQPLGESPSVKSRYKILMTSSS